MTVTVTTTTNQYEGDDSVGPFSYSFRIFDATDLLVTITDEDGAETVLEYPADYDVTGVRDRNGGTVTLTDAVPSGSTITIQRVLDITQETALRQQGAIRGEEIEDALDRGIMIDQQQQEELDRTLKIPVSEDPDDYELTLPTAAEGQAIGWGADGVLTNIVVNGISVESFGIMLDGAAGDGVTDDRAAFVTGIAAAGSTSILIVPPGTYLLGTADLTITCAIFLMPGAVLLPTMRPGDVTEEDPDPDPVGTTITMSGSVTAGLHQWIDTSEGGRVRFARGSVTDVYVEWWGTTTTGLQALFDALATGSNAWNPRVNLSYVEITDTITAPNNLANVEIAGMGKRASELRSVMTTGSPRPVLHFMNARKVTLRDFSVLDQSNVIPTHGILWEVNTAGRSVAAVGNKCINIEVGSDANDHMQNGIVLYADPSDVNHDQNNEQVVIDGCDIINIASRGVWSQNSNSNWNRVRNSQFTNCRYSLSTYSTTGTGGNIVAENCAFGDTYHSDATMLTLYGSASAPRAIFEMSGQRYPSALINCNSESEHVSQLVYTPAQITTGYGGLIVRGGLYRIRGNSGTSDPSVTWNSSTSYTGTLNRLVLDDVTLNSSNGIYIDCPGVDPIHISQTCAIYWGKLKHGGLAVIGAMAQYRDMTGSGQPSASTYATGNAVDGTPYARLVIEANPNNHQNPFYKTITALTTWVDGVGTPHPGKIDLYGIPQDAIIAVTLAAPDAFTGFINAWPGQRVTLLFGNTSTTLTNTAGWLYLQTITGASVADRTRSFEITVVGGSMRAYEK